MLRQSAEPRATSRWPMSYVKPGQRRIMLVLVTFFGEKHRRFRETVPCLVEFCALIAFARNMPMNDLFVCTGEYYAKPKPNCDKD
jgi:hypothetical protein